MRIDAHHHLWTYNDEEFAWIDDRMQRIRRDFDLQDFATGMAGAHIDASIAVQARQSVEETRWLLSLANQTTLVAAVVGWAPILHGELRHLLESWSSEPKLRGLRHIVQAEPSGFMDGEEFNRGLGILREFNLAYDVLITERQMEEAIRLVDRHPHQRFVLDHIGKPRIAESVIDPWRNNLYELARRDNVWCKFSGIVTEAKWDQWHGTWERFADVAVEAFGPNRLMLGSDWPVCLLATEYAELWQTMETYFSSFSQAEKEQLFGGTAKAFYGFP